MALSVLALNGYQSVKFNFEHFIEKTSSYRLKSCYYTLNESRIDLNIWTQELLRAALRLLPRNQNQPLVLSIDDTMIEKSGCHFEHRAAMFDHARHNNTGYLNGHCFVCLLACVPVQDEKGGRYISVPVGYRMWTKEKSKLDMACELVKSAMNVIGSEQPVCLCCDSWYPKGTILDLPKQFDNLTLICNVRGDTVLYDLPPAKTGKRGRPRQHGEKLTLDDFTLFDVPDTDYCAGYRQVMTNLFDKEQVFAIVTKSRSGNSKRLFLCSKSPTQLKFDLAFLSEATDVYAQSDAMLLPLSIYALRWNIEVAFYEQKTFWALGDYMLRSGTGVERLINLLTLVYSSMTLLPYLDRDFSRFMDCSAQQTRFLLGNLVRKHVFLTTFADVLETKKNLSCFAKRLRSLAFHLLHIA